MRIERFEDLDCSVMNNIAEGFGNQSNAELKRFLTYARRSVSEVQSCLYVALDHQFVNEEEFQKTYVQAEAKIIDRFFVTYVGNESRFLQSNLRNP